MQKASAKKTIRRPQHQPRPGSEQKMKPQPLYDDPSVKGTGKLNNKVAIITGGDSGIGKAVAVLFAKEGADIVISYLDEHKDAKETARIITEEMGRNCLLVPGKIESEKHCQSIVTKTMRRFGKIDILINNAALHYESESLEEISASQLLKTFQVNIFSFFFLTKAALKYMKENSCIINTSSVTAYRGSGGLMDYAATKGAIVSFTRSLSANLVKKGIRVNGVAPGPIWTPLIVSSFKSKKVAQHGSDAPMGRAGEPVEVAPSYLFLASDDARYITGQFLHPNGGEIING